METSSLRPTFQTLRGLFPWFSTCQSCGESSSNPLLNSRFLLTRNVTTLLVILTVPLPRFLSCLPLLAPLAASTVSLCEFYFCRLIGQPKNRYFAASGVELAQTNQDLFHFRRAAFYSQLKSLAASTLTSMEHLLFPLLRYPRPESFSDEPAKIKFAQAHSGGGQRC